MKKWKMLADRAEHLRKDVEIALVGKYTKLEDAYASVIKALNHASLALNYRLRLTYIAASDLENNTKKSNPVQFHEAWKTLCQCQGVLIPGGFGQRGIEGKIAAAQWARTTNKPLLGVCMGLQCAVIEFARNVLGKADANSTEIDPDTTHPVVIDMPEHNQGQLGGTMRLGKRQTIFKTQDSVMRQLYGNETSVEERHRHRYEVNPNLVSEFENAGMIFVGHDADAQRMEIMELKNHTFYVAVQYHPEYLSRPMRPSPPYLGLILAATGKLEAFLAKGCQAQRQGQDDTEEFSSDEEDDAVLANLVKSTFIKEITPKKESESQSSMDSPRSTSPN